MLSFIYFKLPSHNAPVAALFDDLGQVFTQYKSFRAAAANAGCFIVNTTDARESFEVLSQVRSDPKQCLKPVYMVHDTGPTAMGLADGLVADAREARAKYECFMRYAAGVIDRPDPGTAQERVLHYLYLRPELLLTPVKDWQHPHLYDVPLVALLTEDAAGASKYTRDLRARGLLEPVALIDRVRACRECGDAHVSFIDVCPNCQGISIGEETFLHCYTCGNVAPQGEYVHTEGLSCPKCYVRLRHIGVDFDRALDSFSCHGCRHIFGEPEIKARCHICQWSGSAEQLVARPVESLKLSDAGRLAVRTGNLGDVFALLDNLNYVNPPYFRHITDWCIKLARRHNDFPCGLLHIKLDNVSALIEKLGRNRVLLIMDGFAERLRELIRSTDLATRTGEQLIWLLLPHTPDAGCRVVLGRILALQALTTQPDGSELVIKGAYASAPGGITPAENAEIVMAKLAGEVH